MKTLVTGGAGFIGSHVVDLLLQHGHDVRVYDKLVEQVHAGIGPQYVSDDAEFVAGDVCDRGSLARALRGVDTVVHLAAEVGVGRSMYEISRYTDTNAGGTAMLLDIITNDKLDVAKIVVASSKSIYGEGLHHCPQHGQVAPRMRTGSQLRERDWEVRCPDCGLDLEPLPTRETKPLVPTSVYAISKMGQELLCLSVGAAYGLDVTAVRYFNAYGPRQSLSNPHAGVAAVFSGRLVNGRSPIVMEDGHQRRDFVHVSDVARATVRAITAPKASGQAINIGVGDPITVLEVAELLGVALGRADIVPTVTGRYRAGDIRHCWADPTRARALLDFEPEYHFRDNGVRDLVEWVGTQTAVDRAGAADDELRRRGLTV